MRVTRQMPLALFNKIVVIYTKRRFDSVWLITEQYINNYDNQFALIFDRI